jgi:hypothetical protein
MYAIDSAILTAIPQIPVNLAISIDTSRLKPKLFDQACKAFILPLTCRFRAVSPGIVPTGMNI